MKRISIVWIAAGLVLSGALPVRAERPEAEVSPECERAIRKGIDYLKKAQNGDGSWGRENRVAKTALCGLALLADGSTPRCGSHAAAVRRAALYLLSKIDATGVISDDTYVWANSHNHGYAMLFLAQAYGETGPEAQEKIGRALRRAISACLKAQGPDGGWGYSVQGIGINGLNDEGSCSVVQLQALRACRDIGFEVPKTHIDKAAKYLRDCAEPGGGFMYSLAERKGGGGMGVAPRFSVASADLVCLDSAGIYTDEVALKGIQFIAQYEPVGSKKIEMFPLYGLFYAAQVYHMRGGDNWKRFCPAVQRFLMKVQDGAGKWPGIDSYEQGEGYGGPELNTAFALLVLELPYRLLPLYQR